MNKPTLHNPFVVFLNLSQFRFQLPIGEAQDVRPMATVKLVDSNGFHTHENLCSERSTEDFALHTLDVTEAVVVLQNLGQFRIVTLECVNHSDGVVVVAHDSHSDVFLFVNYIYITKFNLFFPQVLIKV
jgi:hypothetical protein